jgi:biopolymer transport protein TolQ
LTLPSAPQLTLLLQGLDDNPISLALKAGTVVKLTLLLLLGFSVASWAVILAKHRALARAARHTRRFLKAFRDSAKFAEVKQMCPHNRASPLVGLFLAGFNELNYQLRSESDGPLGEHPPSRPVLRNLGAVERALLRAAQVEIARMERSLSFLATTGSVTPFIGLFGTVWGIMNAFSSIGMQRSTSLATVAPHIAEALIATAVGLIAAIPAVMAYNHFLSRVRGLSNELDDFRLEFLSVLERNFG